MEIILIPLTAFLAALAGGSVPYSEKLNKQGAVDDDGNDKGGIMPFDITWLPEFIIALIIGYASYHIIGVYALGAIIWSYLWMQTGHHHALYWGRDADPSRSNTLTPVVNWICGGCKIKIRKKTIRLPFDIEHFSRAYSAVFFAVKGFLLTLPIGGLGVFFWPLAYDIGVYLQEKGITNNKYGHAVSELLSGLFLGILVYSVIQVT